MKARVNLSDPSGSARIVLSVLEDTARHHPGEAVGLAAAELYTVAPSRPRPDAHRPAEPVPLPGLPRLPVHPVRGAPHTLRT